METSTLITLLSANVILSLLALSYQIVKNDTKISFSNILWALALFGLPVVGVLFYAMVQIMTKLAKGSSTKVEGGGAT
jgi:uncharacterized oligopeptide transporter (OPT) family protein